MIAKINTHSIPINSSITPSNIYETEFPQNDVCAFGTRSPCQRRSALRDGGMSTMLRSLRPITCPPYPVWNYFRARRAFVSSAHFSSSCRRRQGCGRRVFFTPPALSTGALKRRPRSGLETIAAITIPPARPLSSTTPLFDDTIIVTKRCAEVWLQVYHPLLFVVVEGFLRQP